MFLTSPIKSPVSSRLTPISYPRQPHFPSTCQLEGTDRGNRRYSSLNRCKMVEAPSAWSREYTFERRVSKSMTTARLRTMTW
jgi:hypothetical protein